MKPIRQKELPTPSKQVSPYIIIKKKECEEIIIQYQIQQFIINRIEKKRYLLLHLLLNELINYV